MKKKVSVIIPNYNAGEFIGKCVESVINQSYKNIEIIIIDDGSTDNSWEVIECLKAKDNITVIRQPNLNASIARNRGIDLATGSYALFLDSDDELCDNAIEILVNEFEKNNVELVVGNFILIDKNNNKIKDNNVVDRDFICTNPMEVIGIIPNPSNKLFNLEIIKKNNIYFGNVRIGQDLNFYLKYILYCKSIKLINKDIYMWRKLGTSMSNSCNLRIFDITETFRDIKLFYKQRGYIKLYEQYIKIIEYRHYYLQMEKQKNFKQRKIRKIIVDFFKIKLEELEVKDCKNFQQYKSDYVKSKIKLFFKTLYISKGYYLIDKINSK